MLFEPSPRWHRIRGSRSTGSWSSRARRALPPERSPPVSIWPRLRFLSISRNFANAALIEPRQEGRFVYYSANYKHMNGLLAFLSENCCQGACVAKPSLPRKLSRSRRSDSRSRRETRLDARVRIAVIERDGT
jgi:hypothetical protein